MTSSAIKNTFSEIIHPEKAKFILPTLLSALILITGAVTTTLTDSTEYPEKTINSSTHAMSELTRMNIEEYYFGKNYTERKYEYVGTSADKIARAQQKTPFLIDTALLYATYHNGLIPVMPGKPIAIGENLKEKSLIYTSEKGYYLKPSAPKALTEIIYLQQETTDLEEQINRSRGNWTLEKFRGKYNQIRSKNAEDINFEEFEEGSFTGYLLEPKAFKKATTGELKQVKFVHFLPAAGITFLIYYLLSGILLIVGRKTIYLWSGYRLHQQ